MAQCLYADFFHLQEADMDIHRPPGISEGTALSNSWMLKRNGGETLLVPCYDPKEKPFLVVIGRIGEVDVSALGVGISPRGSNAASCLAVGEIVEIKANTICKELAPYFEVMPEVKPPLGSMVYYPHLTNLNTIVVAPREVTAITEDQELWRSRR